MPTTVLFSMGCSPYPPSGANAGRREMTVREVAQLGALVALSLAQDLLNNRTLEWGRGWCGDS